MSEILKTIEAHCNCIFSQKKTGPKQIDPGISHFYPQDHPMLHILINLIRAPEQDFFK